MRDIVGDAVKALNDSGKVGGYLVRFSSEDDPDLVGDYFTKDTDFGSSRQTDILYNHALDGTLKGRVLGQGDLSIDNVGVWVQAQLALADDYEKAIFDMVKKGKLRWSSGTAPHLVERVPMGNAKWIKTWKLGLDATLTPTPAEPRAVAVALKSLEEQSMEEQELETVTQAGNEEIKALRNELETLRTQIETAPAVKAAAFIPGDTAANMDEYTKSFDAYLRGGALPKSLKSMDTGSGSAGAWVPAIYSDEYARKLALSSVMRRAGVRTVMVPDGQPFNMAVNDLSSISATPGAGIVSENTSFNEAEAAPSNVQFTPYLYTARSVVSMMLINDSRFDVGSMIGENFNATFAAYENRDCFVGTGTSMPQGITSGGTAVDTASGTFAAADVKTLYYSMPEQYRIAGRCAWFANDTILKEIDSFVASAGGNYIWQPALAEGAPGMLMGYPVYGAPYMASTMEEDDAILAFVNLDSVALVEFGSMSLRRLDETYAASGGVGFIGYRRVDFKVLVSEAVRILTMAA